MHGSTARRFWSVAVLIVAVAGIASPSVADPGSSRTSGAASLDEVRHELAESSEAMVHAAAALRQAQRSLEEARADVATAQRRLVVARERQEDAAQVRLRAQSELLAAARSADASAARVDEQRARLGRVARAAYQQGGAFTNAAVLLQARTPGDFTERLVALDQVALAQRSILAELETAEAATERVKQSFEASKDRAASAHVKAQAEVDKVADLVRAAAAAELRVQRLVTAERAALAAAEAAYAEDERRLLELRGESDRLATLLRDQARALLGKAGTRAGTSHPVRPRVVSWPLVAPVTSPFGMRVHPVTGVHKLHTGTDFGAACGTPIKSARGGTVIAAGFNRAYGWRTVISHGVVAGALLTTTYNHQTDVGVEIGQFVAGGDVIGTVGTTGYSTGCHLHFELIINSDMVDPLPWLAAT